MTNSNISGNQGVKYITLGEEDMAALYENRYDVDMETNQYLFLKNIDGEIVDKFRWDGNELVPLRYKMINNPRFGKVKPLNDEQIAAFDLLQNDNITVKVLTGIAGSGKNYMSYIYALDAVERGFYNKIVLVRNNVEVRDTNNLGALPAGINEKLLPFAMPMADLLGNTSELFHLLEMNKIELLHLGFARGRSFDQAIIVVDEAENLSRDHVALLISRVGRGSVIIFLGDRRQTDKTKFESDSGIDSMNKILFGNKLYGTVNLTHTERSKTAELSELLY